MDYQIIVKNGIRYITVPRLEELGLNNYFTTSDLNMRLGSIKRPNGSIDNYNKIFKLMNTEPREVFLSKQNHTDNITIIKRLHQGENFQLGKIIDNNDGLITDLENIVLVSHYADCTPILLYDPIKKVHANIHSGWKGTLQKIGKKASYNIQTSYNSDPSNILAVLGPSIDKFDFEVDYDVMLKFKKTFPYDNMISEMNNGKFLIDLDLINKNLLMESGILEENILNIDMSTMSTPMLHSYRRDKGAYCLMAMLTSLK